MHRSLLLCLAFFGVALCATNLCVGGARDGTKSGAEQCDPSATVTDDSCCDKNCRYRLNTYVCSLGEKCFSQTYCSGSSETCPKADNFLPNADCAFGGECYAPPKCDPEKKDGTCLDPTPRTKESNFQCYTGDPSVCTIDAYCDGESLDCPNHYAPSSAKCREGTDCAEPTYCPGEDADESEQEACPDTVFKTSECAAADPSNCKAASYCDGENDACPVQEPADSDVSCSSDTDTLKCINGYKCSGLAVGTAACNVPVPADEGSECDSGAADPSNCQAASTCDGTTGDNACDAQAADSDTVCDSSSVNPNTCTGVSKCSGDAIGASECAAVPAGDDVTCREEDACNDAQTCDGETMTCPDSPKDDDTDCSDAAKCDKNNKESAKCTDGVCGKCETPGAKDDPMITGFLHQRFWFEAESGTIYNFFSQPGVQINVLIKDAHPDTLKKMTAIGAVGFITANNKVVFDAINGPLGKFIINGKNVTFTAKQNMMDINDCVQMAWAPTSVLFSSAEFEIVVAFKEANPKEALLIPYLNLKFVHVSGDVKQMSGIIGITARDVKARQHGFEAKVSDIVGHDAPLTTFTGASLACEANMKRSDNQMGAATQHQLDDLKRYAYTYA